MLFDADPDQIAALDSTSLVKLLRRLALSESRRLGIPLRSASIPLQITIADDGEDGRVEWDGGVSSSAYLPARYTAFQSKAQNLSESRVKAEVLKKPKKGPLKLNPTVAEVLSSGGAYVIFCRERMVTKKRKNLIKAIKEAITAGGGNPKAAAAIDIYDANIIADWVNTHPSVALWLASLKHGRNLAGFQTHDGWGRDPEFLTTWQASDEPRFAPVNRAVALEDRKDERRSAWTFDQAADELLKVLSDEKSIVRLFGPSGFGKSRFIFEVLKRKRSIADEVDRSSVIFCDGSISGDEAARLMLELADAGLAAIVVVDECPDDLHNKLANIARRTGSNLRLITMDIETKVLQAADTLSLRVEKADEKLIKDIAVAVAPDLSDRDKNFIADLAEGFPRMAVLAAQQDADGRQTFLSVEQILARIIWSGKQRVPEAQRALEVACLFEWFGLLGRVDGEAAFVAAELASLSLPIFVEHVLSFKSRGIITQRGDFIQVGPVPLAARLGIARLEVMTPEQLFQFFQKAPDTLQFSMLKRLKWLDTSDVVRSFAERMLHSDMIGNFAALNTDTGSKMLDLLVHLTPDIVSDTMERVFGGLSQAELTAARDGRRYLVWALEKLVFRRQTFERSARLLLRLAAAENENNSNNASGQFKQLYQLYLGGTEAEPSLRVRVLDEGLASTDPKQRAICVEALGHMLPSGHYSRGGGAEQIGSSDALEDWRPKTYGEIWDFYRAAIARLVPIAISNGELAVVAKKHLSSHIRSLLAHLPVSEIRDMILTVQAHGGFWPDALMGISHFLFYDCAKEKRSKIAKEVRQLYDDLLPSDPVDLAALYTDGWKLDLHDPDSSYDPNPRSRDNFDYAEERAVAIADEIVKTDKLITGALNRIACGSGNGTFPFAKALMKAAKDPEALFSEAINVAERSDELPNRGFYGGLISGADERDPKIARVLVRLALQSTKLKGETIALIGSGTLNDEDVDLIVSLVASGDIKPWQVQNLGLWRSPEALFIPVLQELEKHGNDGLWTVVDIVAMFLHGGSNLPSKELKTLTKRVLLAPKLFEGTRNNMDGYHMEQLVHRLIKLGAIDKAFAAKLAKQLMSICRRGTDSFFYKLDDPVRKALGYLLEIYPDVTWAAIARKLSSKTWHDRFYAENLLESHHRDDHLARALAVPVPPAIYMAWVREKPKERAPKALAWLPIADRPEKGPLVWHPELSAFVDEFCDIPEVLQELGGRLSPNSYSGGLAPYLEPIVPLVEAWASHPKASVRAWVPDVLSWLRKTIVAERKRSEEEVVRYG